MMLKKLIAIFVTNFVLLTAINCQAQPPAGFKMPPIPVEIESAKQIMHQQSIDTTGTFIAIRGITIRPEINGSITKIYFKSGQEVHKGDKLLQLNDAIWQAKLIQAQADLKLATLNWQRAQKLLKSHAISQADADTDLAKMKAAEGQVAEIEAYLAQSLLRAPFAGKLGLRQVSEGDYITAGTAIVNLQALDAIEIDFSIPEIYLGAITVGQKIALAIDAYPEEKFYGTIIAIDSKINPATRSLDVRATVPNENHKLLPGIFATINVPLATVPAITIPQIALMYDSKGTYIYKVVHDKAIQQRVTVQSRDEQDAIISTGLNTGDIVVIAGQIKLHDNAPVMTR